MAVPEQTPYKEYTANGVTTSFPLEFDCENQDHLIVTVNDIEPENGQWSLINGAVVFLIAPANQAKIVIQRNTPLERNTDYQTYNNSFRPSAVNKDFDWIWLKLQELGVADWILSNRINDLRTYVDKQDNVLQDNIDSLKNYVDDKDDELRNYLLNAIQEQGVALDQLEEYYSYLMQQLAQVAIDRGWAASFIVSADGSTQQEINDFGGAKWRNKPLGYDIGSTVKLDNGDIVKSTIDGNVNDPNVDMTGWASIQELSIESIADMLAIENPRDGVRVFVKGYYAATNFALARPWVGGGWFIYNSTKAATNDGVTVFDGWEKQFTNNEFSHEDVGLHGIVALDGISTTAFQKLADALPQTLVLNFNGEFLLGDQIEFTAKKSITVNGNNATFKIDYDSWNIKVKDNKYGVRGISYDTLDNVTTTYQTYTCGLFVFMGVRDVYVDAIQVYGCNKNAYLDAFVMEGFQVGDTGIAAYCVKNYTVINSRFENLFGWGIKGANVTNATIHDNVIKGITHQSGVSVNIPASNDQSKVDIYSNYIEDVGLYGVELESHANTPAKASIYNNTIIDCFSAITATGEANRYKIYDNNIFNAWYGMWFVNLQATLRVEACENTLTGVVFGGVTDGLDTSNIYFHHNTLIGASGEVVYRKGYPDHFIWEVESADTFLINASLSIGVTYYINESIKISVKSQSASGIFVRNDRTKDDLYRVVINENVLTTDMKFKFLKRKVSPTDNGEAGFVSRNPMKFARIYDNYINKFSKGILTYGRMNTGNYSEKFFNNTIENVIDSPIFIQDDNGTSRSFRNNTSLVDTPKQYNGAVELGCVALKPFESFNIAATTGTSPIVYPKSYPFSAIPAMPIYAIDVVLLGTNQTADGNLVLNVMDESSVLATYTAQFNVVTGNIKARFFMPYKTLAIGLSNISYVFQNTDSTLTYTGGRLVMMTD